MPAETQRDVRLVNPRGGATEPECRRSTFLSMAYRQAVLWCCLPDPFAHCAGQPSRNMIVYRAHVQPGRFHGTHSLALVKSAFLLT